MGWPPPTASMCQSGGVSDHPRRRPWTRSALFGLDLAKHVFQAHGADSAGAVVFRRKLRRGQVLSFFAALPPCTVAMEACAGAHHWGREIVKLGHSVRLIAPAYVKPFVKRQKKRYGGCRGDLRGGSAPDHALRGRKERGNTGRHRCLSDARSPSSASGPKPST